MTEDDNPALTVRNYLNILRARLNGEPVPSGDAEDTRGLVGELLPVARVFHMSPVSYYAAHHAANVYTTATLAGLPLVTTDRIGMRENVASAYADLSPTVESELLTSAIVEGLQHEPFPSPLPFPVIYIGFGKGVPLTRAEILAHVGVGLPCRRPTSPEVVASFSDGYHLGYTIGRSRTCGDVVIEHLETSPCMMFALARYVELAPLEENDSGFMRWGGRLSLAPWITNGLIALLNENFAQVRQHPVSASTRYEYSKLPRSRAIPRPYYAIHLTRSQIDDSFAKSPTLGRYMFHYTYRFDVRSHERLRVQRGTGTLVSKDRVSLFKRGYIIYDDPSTVPTDLLLKLDLRRVPRPLPGEWLAVLTTKVGAHQKGPEDAPYVPALRHGESVRNPP